MELPVPAFALFYARHPAVSRLHGNIAYVVRVAGENTVPAGGFGIKPRRSTVSYCIDLASRTGLLLRDLPSRHIPGYCFMAGGETEKKSFPVFPRLILAKIRGFGDIYPCHGRRIRCMGRIDRTLQRLRTYRLQFVRPSLAMGKQPAGLLSRTGRQLCILRNGSLAAKPPYFHHCSNYLYHSNHTCLAKRTEIGRASCRERV